MVGLLPASPLSKYTTNQQTSKQNNKHYMGQFGQFELNRFKRGQTHFSQLHISLDPILCAV